jgi:hypothetical protein
MPITILTKPYYFIESPKLLDGFSFSLIPDNEKLSSLRYLPRGVIELLRTTSDQEYLHCSSISTEVIIKPL